MLRLTEYVIGTMPTVCCNHNRLWGKNPGWDQSWSQQLWGKKSRLREVKKLVRGHTAGK